MSHFSLILLVMPVFSGYQVEIVGGKSVSLGVERSDLPSDYIFFPQ